MDPRSDLFGDLFTIEEHYSIREVTVTRTSSPGGQSKRRGGRMVKKFTPSQVTIDGKKHKKAIGEENKPPSEPWRQNKLNAWSPVYTPQAVLPSLMIIGIAFIPIGVGLLYTSYHVKEFRLDYTECLSSDHDSLTCASILELPESHFEPNQDETSRILEKRRCFCNIKFRLNHDFDREVFFYYGMSRYYQSLRRYATSYDDKQLRGSPSIHLSHSCRPFKKTNDSLTGEIKPIAPCGAIANSLFNDTFSLYYFLGTDDQIDEEQEHDNDVTFNPLGISPLDVHYQPSNSSHALIPISIIETDISWPSDRMHKYHNPQNFDAFTKPIYWLRDVLLLDPGNPSNNGYLNEHLIVWMRTAAFPTFRKLWGRIYHEGITEDKLPKGYYLLTIEYNYPVMAFDGRKSVILSNTSWFGGREFFLGIAYIAFGSFTVLLTATLFVIQRLYGFTTKEMVDIHVSTPYVDEERKKLVYRDRKRTLASIFTPHG